MIEKEVVGGFIMHKGKILLLKRSPSHSHGNEWGVVSGFIEKGETSYQATLREIFEEVSIEPKELKLIKEASIIKIQEEDTLWIVHPFLFETNSDKIKLEKEHEEYRWISPEEIYKFDFVIGLDKDMRALGLLKN